MEIKQWQWVREENLERGETNFFQVADEVDAKNFTKLLSVNKFKITVADTPQELVHVGDLVFFDDREQPILNNGSIDELPKDLKKGEIEYLKKHCIKILTPNSKGDYIKQYEEKGE